MSQPHRVQLAEMVMRGGSMFRRGTTAIIVDVAMVTPKEGLEPRLCYLVMWPDGIQDWVAVRGGGEFDVKVADGPPPEVGQI